MRLAGLALVGGAVACSGGDGADDAATDAVDGDGCAVGGAPTLTIGTGETAYAALGDTLELVHGPQGGYHVLIGFEATHLDTSAFAIGLVEGTIGGEIVARTAPYLDFRCNPETGTLQSWGTLLIYPLLPEELDNEETHLTATVTDAAGLEVVAERTTVIDDPLL